MKHLIVVTIISIAAALFAAPAHSVEVGVGVGGVSADLIKGGTGGSKSATEVYVKECVSMVCGKVSAYRVAEPMDDDAGIVPASGYTASLTGRVMKHGLIGYRYDDFGFRLQSAVVGLAAENVEAAFLIPLESNAGKGRVGFTANMRAPLTKSTAATFGFDWIGTEDPDIKVGKVMVGLSYRF